MRRFLSLALALIMLLSLASCSGRGDNGAIYYSLSKSPSTLDPQYAGETEAHVIIGNAFEGLVRRSAEGEIISGIAESWSISPDNLTYTFNLKPDTEWYCPTAVKSEFGEDFYNKFSSEKVTANDFVFAIKRAVSPETKSPSAHRLFIIKNAAEIHAGNADISTLGVTAADNNTLVIKLTEACPDFLERLTESVFMPCNEEFFNATGGRYGLSHKHILCNGPFYISSWDSETTLTIRRNNYYAGEQEVIPSLINFGFDFNAETIGDEISAGNISAAFMHPDSPIPQNSIIAKSNPNSVFGFFFNCSDEYLQNANLRIALCSSIDRSLFASAPENAELTDGFVPKNCSAGSLNYREAVTGQTPKIGFDTSIALINWKKAVSELGKDKVQLTVLCPEWLDSAVRNQLQIWQKTMGVNLGITIENKTPSEIRAAVGSGNYQIALTGTESPYSSAVDFLASFKSGGIFRFAGADYGTIIDRLMSVESDNELLGGCYTAENYILQQGICYPLYSRSSSFVTAEDIEGIAVFDSESSISFIGTKRFD
ncbi:MAG: peptide ABC transporter substrate-binding protein [Clostridia bacterium]|nr:peptide ABC transporter substrate-binding protein [Clostridia bacterium]